LLPDFPGCLRSQSCIPFLRFPPKTQWNLPDILPHSVERILRLLLWHRHPVYHLRRAEVGARVFPLHPTIRRPEICRSQYPQFWHDENCTTDHPASQHAKYQRKLQSTDTSLPTHRNCTVAKYTITRALTPQEARDS